MQPLPQRLALHKRHDVIQQTGGLARVEQREDMRMAELGGEADLTEEALGAQHGGQLGAQDLDGHAPLVFPVLCEVDGRHPPVAQLALDRVAIGERSPKSIERVGHSRGPREVTGVRYVPRSRLWTSPPRRSRALPRDADSCVCACSLADGGSSGRGPGGARRRRALSRKDQVGDFSNAVLMGKKQGTVGSHPSVSVTPAPYHTGPADLRPGGQSTKVNLAGTSHRLATERR